MKNADLRLGDCIAVMATLPENSIDTIITDPPYGLRFMGKDWDTFRQDRRTKSQVINLGSGMKQPSKSELAEFQEWCRQWASEAFRIAKPGAFLLAFGGTRTFHRLVSGIEDAGWEIRDSIAWLYGSGFPKSYNISKGIEKQAGILGTQSSGFNTAGGSENYGPQDKSFRSDYGYVYEPQDPSAKLWNGWGTSLKPAMELICVAMKPLDKTFVNNAFTWGVSGLWIDGGRVGTDEELGRNNHVNPYGSERTWSVSKTPPQNNVGTAPKGRFPANIIHDGSEEVVSLFPETGKVVGRQTQYSESDFAGDGGWKGNGIGQRTTYDGEGSAARFFYCAKPGKGERNDGTDGNSHPTIKPIALMRYLVRLTKTPTGGVVLDPFMGSGTTGIACELEGRDFIGIELNDEYFAIAEKRIANAQGAQQKLFSEEA